MNERKADLRTLRQPGTYPNTEDRAALRLAEAIHYAESQDCAVSWSAQERAETYFNAHGLIATLDEATRLEAAVLPAEEAEGAIDDCINWTSNGEADCGGRLMRYRSVRLCETCLNRPPSVDND